ncbi:hypothetical protein JHK87_010140 [Glycine soja]|nr:hypothetical protein JHK87_010140 [Glycine soja]
MASGEACQIKNHCQRPCHPRRPQIGEIRFQSFVKSELNLLLNFVSSLSLCRLKISSFSSRMILPRKPSLMWSSDLFKVVYILDQVRALEEELIHKIELQGIDVKPQILVWLVGDGSLEHAIGALKFFHDLKRTDPMMFVRHTMDSDRRLQHLFSCDGERKLNSKIVNDYSMNLYDLSNIKDRIATHFMSLTVA